MCSVVVVGCHAPLGAGSSLKNLTLDLLSLFLSLRFSPFQLLYRPHNNATGVIAPNSNLLPSASLPLLQTWKVNQTPLSASMRIMTVQCII